MSGCRACGAVAGQTCGYPGLEDRPDGCVGPDPAPKVEESRRWERLTARQQMAAPDPPEGYELVGPLLVRTQRTLLVGDTGGGKTTLALQMLRAGVEGGDFLSWTGAGDLRALVVDLEQGLRSTKRSLRDAGLADSEQVDIVRVPDGIALDTDTDDLAAFEQDIVESRADIVLLDPYYKAYAGDANEERAVADLFRVLDGLRARHGFALLLPVHPRKSVAGDGLRRLSLADVFGSGVVTRGAEVVLALERLAHGYARLRTLKDRDGDLPVGEDWPLLFTRGEGFRLDPKEERTAEELEQRILADTRSGALRTNKEWASELGIREGRAKKTLEALAEAGEIDVVIGPPGRSARARCYGTAPEGWAQSGEVTPSLPESSTAPLLPTAIGAVGAGSSTTTAPTSGAVDDQPTLEQDAELALSGSSTSPDGTLHELRPRGAS